MFSDDYSLETLDLRRFDTSAAQSIIQPKAILAQDVGVAPRVMIYGGKAVKPRVTAASGVTFDAAYDGNAAPGAGTVTVTGTGNYCGSVVLEFTVLDKASVKTLNLPAALKQTDEAFYPSLQSQ